MSSVIETAGLSNTNVGTLRCLFEVMEHKLLHVGTHQK